jgi:protein phosphatase
MGATMVCFMLDPWYPNSATIFHAGDSRAYRIRKDKIEQLTEDHTVAAASNVSESKIAPMLRGVLTNALGTGTDFFLERTSIDVQEDDVFILCSDGLTRMVPDSDILQLFSANRASSSEIICKKLLENALDNGGRDNVSVILVRIQRLGEEYTPNEDEAERESEAQLRNLMELTDTPPTEVINVPDAFKRT